MNNMFSSPTLSRSNKQISSIDMMHTKRILDEKSKTIEQLKTIIDELNLRHERKERDLLKRIGTLYNELQQNKKKMAHLIYKHQQQKKINDETKSFQDFSTQTDETNLSTICSNCSNQYNEKNIVQVLSQLQLNSQDEQSEQQPKYYTLQAEEDVEYICATPQPTLNQSLSSPALSTTDRSSTRSSCSHHHCSTSSTKHNESSSSAYNTAESLPSSTYSDEVESLERVLNAACTMYTTHHNLEHTIKLQEQLFRQRLRLRGITLDNDDGNDSSSSEHLYDNIDGETSDIEKQSTVYRNRLITSCQKKKSKQNINLSTDDDEQNYHQQQQQQKSKISKHHKVRFSDQYHVLNRRKNFKSNSRTNLAKSITPKRNTNQKKLSLPLSSNMLTVTIT